MLYKDLAAYKKSLDFVLDIYQVSGLLPDREKFGLVSQMQRAAISVPSNIAEGSVKNTDKEFVRYLYISQGSLAELETQLVICQRLDYIDNDTLNNLLMKKEQIAKMIYGLINHYKKVIGDR